MTGSMFCTCPYCLSDLGAGTNPDYGGADCRHGCGRPEHYSIALAIYNPDTEQVVAWQCPDCGKRWER